MNKKVKSNLGPNRENNFGNTHESSMSEKDLIKYEIRKDFNRANRDEENEDF